MIASDDNTIPATLPRRVKGRADAVDGHVGHRIRLRRTLIGMTQEGLGEAVGLTFQQIQKYENGDNRVSASRLYAISQALDVPIHYFFDEMPDNLMMRRTVGVEGPQHHADESLTRRKTLELVRAFYRIDDAGVRERLFELAKALGPDTSGE